MFRLLGTYSVVLQNGVLLQAVMGKSSTAGAGPYTHTITPPTNQSPLDSFTIQHERTGTATAWATQFTGCKVAGLTLTCNFSDVPYLTAVVHWMAKKAADPGFTLTTAPALPATANGAPYLAQGMTRTWDYGGTPLTLDGLMDMELTISPDLIPLYAHSWDGATYTGQWLYDILESPRKKYRLVMRYHPSTVEDDLWDELIAASNTKEILFKWARSATDYIQVTLTDCSIYKHPLETPETGKTLTDLVEIEPRAVSFEVKDQIAATHYGE